VAAQGLVYERIYNPQAFAACSAMPRFGHNGVLTPSRSRTWSLCCSIPVRP